MSAHAIANKFRRALRNETGANFTFEQLRAMAGYGILIELSRIEANELCPINEAAAPRTQDLGSSKSASVPRGSGPLDIAVLSKGL